MTMTSWNQLEPVEDLPQTGGIARRTSPPTADELVSASLRKELCLARFEI